MEDFFRVLKSGCRTEFLLFRSAERLQRAIAINAVIAWRIMLMTLLGREVPDCDAELMFTDEELSFLRDYARAAGGQSWRLPGSQARSGSRAPGDVARVHAPGQRRVGARDRLQGRNAACPEECQVACCPHDLS